MNAASESVKRPLDTPKLTKWVEAAGTDTTDMVIKTQINAEQTNVSAGNGKVRS